MIKNSLIILFFCFFSTSMYAQKIMDKYGAIIRSDTTKAYIYLCFTGHDFDEGFDYVLEVLQKQKIVASFFLTGDFIRNHKTLVKNIIQRGNFVGAHSDKHLLYCDWSKRDSLLHSPESIKADIVNNLKELNNLGIQANYFMPPYEWYNKKVVEIAQELNQITVNFSPGTRSNADYTTPNMPNYISSKAILNSIESYEKSNGMNGFHLLIHPGTNPLRKDKLYLNLEQLISEFKEKGYQFAKF